MSTQDRDNWMLFEMDSSGKNKPDEFARVQSYIDSLVDPDEDIWNELVLEDEAHEPTFIKRTSSNNYVIQISATPKNTTEADVLSYKYHDEYKHVAEDEILNAVEKSRGPAITTKEVAELVGCTERIANEHLDNLYKEGNIDRKESGNSIIWWPIENDQDLLRGFGALSDTDVPKKMQEEREKLRDEWGDDDNVMP